MNYDYSNATDKQLAPVIEAREQDWRCGAVVYQVLVDRFAPSADLDAKRHLYPAPKTLHPWNEVPKQGQYLEEQGVWSHEIEFWGGDLASLEGKLDYIRELGMDVLYLNPITEAYTNHKYDALNYRNISPEYGTRQDLEALTEAVHEQGMKIMLDGVFNHMGQNSPLFQEAQSPDSARHDWFVFSDQYPVGYRSWFNAVNLPELNLENEAVQDDLWRQPDSVIQGYLQQGIDGWRLDVAHDIGFNLLEEITQSAHRCNPQSLVVGEAWCYPQQWFPSLDGIMNFTARELFWRLCQGDMSAALAGRNLQQMVEDAGIDNLLKSWLILDNHDTPRLTDMLPELWQRKLAMVLHLTFPGSPNIYYGTELGMTGGDDPEMRAPMRWDLVSDDNTWYGWMKQMLQLRKTERALRVGNWRLVHSEHFLAYERYTDRIEDSVIVVVNPTGEEHEEYLMIPDSKVMPVGGMIELLGQDVELPEARAAVIKVKLPAHGFTLFKPNTAEYGAGYTNYKRVK